MSAPSINNLTKSVKITSSILGTGLIPITVTAVFTPSTPTPVPYSKPSTLNPDNRELAEPITVITKTATNPQGGAQSKLLLFYFTTLFTIDILPTLCYVKNNLTNIDGAS